MDNELDELGFTNFVHINKEKRDGIKRKAWAGEYKENLIMIIVKYTQGSYVIENINYDYDDADIANLIRQKNDIKSLIKFIRSKCLPKS